MKISEEERRLRHKRFLQANLGMLAAFAWQYYQQEGRGAVIADERDFIHSPQPQFAKISLRYVAEGSPRLTELGGWPGDKEAGWVAAYNPNERIVVLIVREDRGLSSYFLIPTVCPPKAFADQQARANCGATVASAGGGPPVHYPALNQSACAIAHQRSIGRPDDEQRGQTSREFAVRPSAHVSLLNPLRFRTTSPTSLTGQDN